MKNNTICFQAFQELFVLHICRDYRTASTRSGNMLLFIMKWRSSTFQNIHRSSSSRPAAWTEDWKLDVTFCAHTQFCNCFDAFLKRGCDMTAKIQKQKQKKDTFDVWILPDRVQYPYCFSFVIYSLLLWNFWKNNISSVESSIQFLHSVT